MLCQLIMLPTLTGPIDAASIGVGYVIFRWAQSEMIWWMLVPMAAWLFAFIWLKHWRRCWSAKIVRQIVRELDDGSD